VISDSLRAGTIACVSLATLGFLISFNPYLAAAISVGFLAGPHNWMEVRYLLSRLPNRAGKLKTYFLTSAIGTGMLGISSVLLPWYWSPLTLRLWNLALIGWVVILASLRRSENPRRAWPWLEPCALTVAGIMWLYPQAFTLLLVFGHPLLALFILDKELTAFRRKEQTIYRQALLAVPVGLLFLLIGLSHQNLFVSTDLVSFFTLADQTPVFLATHTYLELLHYAVWIGALPVLAKVTRRERLATFPLLKKSESRQKWARCVLILGLVITGVLWWGFAQDYELTRELYFRIAVFHVLIEFPFLVRLS
jgi:hypothetical protein